MRREAKVLTSRTGGVEGVKREMMCSRSMSSLGTEVVPFVHFKQISIPMFLGLTFLEPCTLVAWVGT